MLDVVALFPPPAFVALATSTLMAAFHYPRRRRYAAALSMAGLSTGLTHLHEGLGGLTADLVAVGIAGLQVPLRGETPWYGHPALSRPMKILGVERRWFLLSATFGGAVWNGLNSIITGALLFAVLYVAGFLAWKRDPNMLSIIAKAGTSRTRYDAGKESRWHLHLIE